MRKIQICLFTICLIGLIPQFAECTSETIFATLTNEIPANYYKSPALTSTDNWKLVLTWSGPAAIVSPTVQQVINGAAPTNYDLAHVTSSGGTAGTGYFIASGLSKIDGYLIVKLEFSANAFVTVYGQFFINGVLAKAQTGIFYGSNHVPINQITIASLCRLKIKVNGITPTPKIGVYLTTVGASQPDFKSSTGQLIIDFVKNGTYYIVVLPSTSTFPIASPLTGTTTTPYSLTLYTYCDKFCTSPAFPTAPACTTCGNAILEAGEQCDNGNKAGCNNCFVSPSYTCYGNPGSSSLCMKYPVCGDSIIDQGEQCDNGNRVGCTLNCVPDTGYKCSAVLGTASLCGLCGNGIVEPGEECDNKGLAGCSTGCKVDAGFICQGTSSFCYRKNPVCGNGVIEVAESCDDGNQVNGDGCSQYCIVESDYTCAGQFGESSKCQKNAAAAPVCGNKVVEAGEECDNGKQEGCRACKVESGYTCVGQAAFPSFCFQTVSDCGNGVTEPLKGENCDDGNRNSGDGCSSLCQVEQGWICTDKCVMVGDPRLKVFCGNGTLEVHFGELCDDGNTANNDGCNQNCRVENGWSCRILTYAENKSYCTSTAGLSYCGNGIVEGSETCDDGFPVKSGDGCSTKCQVESGWNCSTGVCRPI